MPIHPVLTSADPEPGIGAEVTQHALREDYGLDPGPVLERLQQQILAGENVELEA